MSWGCQYPENSFLLFTWNQVFREIILLKNNPSCTTFFQFFQVFQWFVMYCSITLYWLTRLPYKFHFIIFKRMYKQHESNIFGLMPNKAVLLIFNTLNIFMSCKKINSMILPLVDNNSFVKFQHFKNIFGVQEICLI